MALQGCALNCATVYLAPMGIGIAKSRSSRVLHSPNKLGFPCTQTSWAPCHNLTSSPGIQRGYLSLASSPHTIPSIVPKRKSSNLSPRAYPKDIPGSYRYPEKARWWWRILASLHYLKPLHEICLLAETTYHIHPFLEDFQFLTYPFWETMVGIPGWVFMAYSLAASVVIAKRKEIPYFLRSHMMMGLLFDTALQVLGIVCRYVPHSVYWGKAGMHFWAAVSFAFLCMVFQCVCSALSGTIADVLFVSDAAYLKVPK